MEIQLRLDKNNYSPTEIVEGVLYIPHTRNLEFKNFKFRAFGEESTEIKLTGGIYSYHELIFTEDLSNFLISSGASKNSKGGFTIPKDLAEFHFKFILPNNIPSSYEGKNARILYKIELDGNRKLNKDFFKDLQINVTNKSTKEILDNSPIIKEKKEKDFSINIELTKKIYYSGDILKGRLTIKNEKEEKKLMTELYLIGIEEVIGLLQIPKIFFINRKKEEIQMSNTRAKYKIDLVTDDRINMHFEFPLPQILQKSFSAKFCKYFWMLEVKIKRRFKTKTISISITII